MTETNVRSRRFGILSQLNGTEAETGELVHRYLEDFVLAEEWGIDTVWVAQQHFTRAPGRLNSPLLFLTALAQRTSRLRLGTAVVTLGLDEPLRVAEDAVFLDAISGGRLELGLSVGTHPDRWAAFGESYQNRHEIFRRKLDTVQHALGGRFRSETGSEFSPDPGTLPERLWRATTTAEGAADTGRRGLRLQIGNNVFERRRPEDQLPILHAYREHAERPRNLVVRHIYPADSLDEAQRRTDAAFAQVAAEIGALSPGDPGGPSIRELAGRYQGHPEDIVAALLDDPLVTESDEIVFEPNPVVQEREESRRWLHAVAEEIIPQLRSALDPPVRETFGSQPASPSGNALR